MSAIKTTILLAAFSLAAITVSAKTLPFVKASKPVATIEARWPQVSVRETLEYLPHREELEPPVPGDRGGRERDARDRRPFEPVTL